MHLVVKSIRTFIGSRDFDVSRRFYSELGFNETIISAGFSVFEINELRFYLQNAYVEDWLNNSMLFIEVPNAGECFAWLQQLQLESKYAGVKLLPVKKEDWGEECFLIDPAGVLLHFGHFN
ncbi:VOC family protein [Mucilaginibacter sp.]